VNGLRAAARTDPGFLGWLAGTEADVVCLQETRAELAQLSAEVVEPQGWHVRLCPALAKGRAGVALYSRREPDAVRVGFGVEEFDGAGRYVEAEDRKSTRLNSSHVSISYAVFCLKRKSHTT